MKFKKGWEEVAKEEMPEALRAKILRGTRLEMDSLAERPPFLSRFWPGLAGVAAAGAAAVVLTLHQTGAPAPRELALRDDPEMVKNAVMLYDLPVLRKLVEAERQKKWPKKKS